jgi:presenilin 2
MLPRLHFSSSNNHFVEIMSSSTTMLPRRELDFAAKTYADLAVVLLIPISITIVVVVWGVTNLTPLYADANASPLYLARDEKTATTTSAKFGDSVVNALVIVAMITVLTFLMVLLYKMNCMKILVGWLLLSAAMIFFFMFWIWIDLVATRYQVPYDFISIAFVQWNFGVVGILSVFYYSHAKLTQAYLVALSIILGWMLTRLPEWSTWMILIFVAFYDIIAVLGPKGPLRMLVEEAQKRNEPLPGFIYDSSSQPQRLVSAPSPPVRISADGEGPVSVSATASEDAGSPAVAPASAGSEPASAGAAANEDADSDDDDGLEAANSAHSFKLGLGDFIFYAVLVGKASSYSYVSWIIAYFCVTTGLVGTLCSLVFLRGKVPALPALPISIFLGVILYFVSRYTAVPLSYSFAATGYAI